MNPYHQFVSEIARFHREGRTYPLGGFPPRPRPEIPPDAPKVLIFSPHPDDECILGALPLRLLCQGRMNVINVAVTLGSNPARQAGRWSELQEACRYLGFGLVLTQPNGFEKVNPKTRQQEAFRWTPMVETIARLLAEHRPQLILFPHDQDWNSTHVGTHLLVMDALESLCADITCHTAETEFWGAMATPNLTVESSVDDVADLVTATTFHVGEVQRNPYHLRLPAWLQDNVRRGAELVGGQGQGAPDFTFATLYRFRRWHDSRMERVYEGGRHLPASADVLSLFPTAG